MLQAAQLIKKERPEIKFFLPVATGIDKKYLEEKINEYGLTVKLCETKTYDLMNCCDFAIATSGTVTLEAALMGLPSIVLYKMSAITYRIAKIFVKIKYFSLPNILVDKQVLPELLQDEVNGENIARIARDLYKDTESAKKVKEELLMVKEKLGSPGVADKTAELILQTVDRFKNEIKG
jgi:lipid-A-disaccharide synthase